ncbi:hypothetical protein SISSUDRAFT_1032561 [Sistotremastrum suecicum HHB10207 ss-3]|uniref:F-box domain-containing protein n=1 Tax=Sistotremastrum suecicum HHB10207 ss-3 TaxID=1314776 RepID=A0A166EG23_9AGAM|nr:hypothetical protein SISSUDRAFT_1032561 [Sistotremastrum suecicum HHB10207 ss-3]
MSIPKRYLDNLAVELVVEILRGIDIHSIFSIAQGASWYWQDLRIHPDLKKIVLRGLMHPRPAPPRVDVLLADIPSLPDPPQAGLNAASPPNLFESLQDIQHSIHASLFVFVSILKTERMETENLYHSPWQKKRFRAQLTPISVQKLLVAIHWGLSRKLILG